MGQADWAEEGLKDKPGPHPGDGLSLGGGGWVWAEGVAGVDLAAISSLGSWAWQALGQRPPLGLGFGLCQGLKMKAESSWQVQEIASL